MRIAGLVLLIVGVLSLAYGGFSYTKEKGDADLGPVKIQITEKERVNVPLWAGLAAAVVGGVMLMRPAR